MTDSETRPMIYVAIACARSSSFAGRLCPAIEDSIPPEDAAAWYANAITEHGWTTDADGNVHCPRHNPADQGTPITLTSESYLPIGDSGWEARVPRNPACDVSFASIEIRKQRWLTAADPEPGRDVVVEQQDGTRWHRTDDAGHDGAANWERVGVDYFEPESWTKVAGNYGPVRVVSTRV